MLEGLSGGTSICSGSAFASALLITKARTASTMNRQPTNWPPGERDWPLGRNVRRVFLVSLIP